MRGVVSAGNAFAGTVRNGTDTVVKTGKNVVDAVMTGTEAVVSTTVRATDSVGIFLASRAAGAGGAMDGDGDRIHEVNGAMDRNDDRVREANGAMDRDDDRVRERIERARAYSRAKVSDNGGNDSLGVDLALAVELPVASDEESEDEI